MTWLMDVFWITGANWISGVQSTSFTERRKKNFFLDY
jgi:hypothetical protein